MIAQRIKLKNHLVTAAEEKEEEASGNDYIKCLRNVGVSKMRILVVPPMSLIYE
jgi:hypothetical protein